MSKQVRNNIKVKEQSKVRNALAEMIVTALFIALVYVFTAFINVRLWFAPNGGLIHLGNVPLFVCALLFGKRSGAIAGGIGMALFDLLSGWTLWAPFTLVIVAIMGFVSGLVGEKKGYGWSVLAMVLTLPIKIGGYYVAEGIIYGNWVVPATSILGNVIQVTTAISIVAIIIVPLKHAKNRIFN